jgi:hypothetical protein
MVAVQTTARSAETPQHQASHLRHRDVTLP